MVFGEQRRFMKSIGFNYGAQARTILFSNSLPSLFKRKNP